MDPEQWPKTAKLLERLEGLTPHEQAAFLEPATYDPVREEVLSLLNQNLDAVTFLDRALFPQPAEVGTWVEGYQIQKMLGQGGMGTVYLATQESPGRTVALKFLSAALPDDDSRLRFQFEQTVLARLNHSYIAKIYGCGTRPQGQPFFAMEYVDGLPLDRFCEANNLGMTMRIHLFMKVCMALSHAHAKGVIHRDLKPSNVLVVWESGEPIPKVIDFGIALSLAENTRVTRQGVSPGTLLYMSPEQATRIMDPDFDDDLDVHTDVYGLGVLLYQLLTGQPPITWSKGEPLAAICKKIVEKNPIKPSEMVAKLGNVNRNASKSARSLVKWLSGDLDWIVFKCLEKDPSDRYASPEHLRSDLQNFLEAKPILAGPPRLPVRVSKFIRRNTLAVLSGVGIVGVVLAFAVVMAWKNRTIAQERNLAQIERERAVFEAQSAKSVSDFLIDMFRASDPFQQDPGKPGITAKEVLDRGTLRVRDVLKNEPQIQARLLEALGLVNQHLGHYPDAKTILGEAVEVNRALLGAQNMQTLTSLVSLAGVAFELGEHSEAESYYREVLTALETRGTEAEGLRLDTQNHLANCLRELGRYEESETRFLQALKGRENLHGPHSLEVAETKNELGILYFERGALDLAEHYHCAAFEIAQHHLAEEHPGMATKMNNIALVLQSKGKWAEAETLHLHVLRLRRKVLPDNHPDIAVSLNNLGLLYHQQGKFQQAEPLYLECIDIREKIYGVDHPLYALSLNNLAGLFYQTQRLQEAKSLFDLALDLRRTVLGNEHPQVAQGMANLGLVYLEEANYSEAERYFLGALEMRKRIFGKDHWDIAKNTYFLAEIAANKKHFHEAEQFLLETSAFFSKDHAMDSRLQARTKNLLGYCLFQQGRFSEAQPLLEESFHLLVTKGIGTQADIQKARDRLAIFLETLGVANQDGVFEHGLPEITLPSK